MYNEDSSPSTPEAKEDIFQCLTVYSNPKFSLANLLPSRLVLERARLSSYRHVIRFKCPPGLEDSPVTGAKVVFTVLSFFALSVLRGFLGMAIAVPSGADTNETGFAL